TMGWGASGNLVSERVQRTGFDVTQNFSYDSVNRLCGAVEAESTAVVAPPCDGTVAGGNWRQTYQYDQPGNRAVNVASSIVVSNDTPQAATGAPVPFDGSNHWTIGSGTCGSATAAYDCAGN